MKVTLSQDRVRDLFPVAATAAVQLGVAALASGHHHRSVGPIAFAFLAAGPIALAFRRRYPGVVLGVTFLAALLYSVAEYYPRGLVFTALIVAFWTAMVQDRRRLALLSLLAGYVVFVIVLPLTAVQPGTGIAWVSGITAWMLLLGAGAEIVRVRHERGRDAAVVRSERLGRIANEERIRIARELHDTLAHNISLINVQASVALHLIEERPDHARVALSAIKDVSHDALGELRSVLDALRPPDERAPRGPGDGLGRLELLLERTRDTGLPLSLHIDGTPRRLPSSIDLAAYRIIQEALTNITRHAPGARTQVLVSYGERDLTLDVQNDDPAAIGANRNGASGNGIPGMQERVASLGGVMYVGPRDAGGFRVHAELPLSA